MRQKFFKILAICVLLLLSLLVIGALWKTEYNPLHQRSSSTFPNDRAVVLHEAVTNVLKQSGVSESSQEHTIQQETRTWVLYEYTLHLPEPEQVSALIRLLRQTISMKGGKIFQQRIQSEKQQVTLVGGVDSFITHSFVITWDAPQPVAQVTPTPEPAQAASTGFRAAIVIDDLGDNEHAVRRLLDLPADLTFSILPRLDKSPEIAALLHDHQREILLHLPMEPQGYPWTSPGKGAILTTMSAEAIQQIIEEDLQRVPYIAGVNNHMGSQLTSDTAKIGIVLTALRQHNLFFLDSRTADTSVAYRVAKQLGMLSAERKVFLDVEPGIDFARRQLQKLATLAEQGQPAIAIGHPKDATIRALQEMLPEFKRRNIEIVRVSQFVH